MEPVPATPSDRASAPAEGVIARCRSQRASNRRKVEGLRRSCLLAGALLFLAACGVKAAPQPPGLPAAKRGVEPPPCPGCLIPGPDTLPSPSVPLKEAEQGEEEEDEAEGIPGEVVNPEEAAASQPGPTPAEGAAPSTPPAAEEEETP